MFAAAVVGAAAALMGLLIVAVSVRLDVLTRQPAAASRGAQALTLLIIPFATGLLVLIPAQPSRLLGVEFLATAVLAGTAFVVLDRRAERAPNGSLSRLLEVTSPNLITTALLVLTGASLTVDWGGGLYWFVPTVLAAVVGGVVSAWLFLVEEVLT